MRFDGVEIVEFSVQEIECEEKFYDDEEEDDFDGDDLDRDEEGDEKVYGWIEAPVQPLAPLVSARAPGTQRRNTIAGLSTHFPYIRSPTIPNQLHLRPLQLSVTPQPSNTKLHRHSTQRHHPSLRPRFRQNLQRTDHV